MIMNLSAAVLVPTIGRIELDQCLRSLQAQTYPVQIYLSTDGIMSHDQFMNLAAKYIDDDVHLAYWPSKIGGKGLEGRRLLAAGASLINEDVLFMLQDDDWFKPNHVESLIQIIEDGNDWAYSLMSVYDKDGQFLFDDICECLGEEHYSWNTPGKNFAPTGSVAMRTECYRNVAQAYNSRDWGPDRIAYNLAKQWYPKFKGSKLHTNCFRLGGNETSSNRDFFDQGIAFMKSKYGNTMPWQTEVSRGT